MPEHKTPEKTICALLALAPALEDELLQRIDTPLSVGTDAAGRRFIQCEYNRDGDSYRSHWDNAYYPALETASDFFPRDELRELECNLNRMLQRYADSYYKGGAVISAYFWPLEEQGGLFACCVVTRNDVDIAGTTGTWNSINVLSIERAGSDNDGGGGKGKGKGAQVYKYENYCTIYITMETRLGGDEKSSVYGYHTAKKSVQGEVREFGPCHIRNIGTLVEQTEVEVNNVTMDTFLGRLHTIAEALLEKKERGVLKDNVASMYLEAAKHFKKKK